MPADHHLRHSRILWFRAIKSSYNSAYFNWVPHSLEIFRASSEVCVCITGAPQMYRFVHSLQLGDQRLLNLRRVIGKGKKIIIQRWVIESYTCRLDCYRLRHRSLKIHCIINNKFYNKLLNLQRRKRVLIKEKHGSSCTDNSVNVTFAISNSKCSHSILYVAKEH